MQNVGRPVWCAAIRGNEWVAGIAQGLNVVKVPVADVRVEHEVRLMDFTKWLERAGGSPREVSDRQRIGSINFGESNVQTTCQFHDVVGLPSDTG